VLTVDRVHGWKRGRGCGSNMVEDGCKGSEWDCCEKQGLGDS
jgi:hypothetical protein